MAEQHNRNECIRIFNFELPVAIQRNNFAVKKHVYSEIIAPTLQLAVEDVQDPLDEVPPLHSLLKNAHPLGISKNAPDGSLPAIIVRFNCVDLKTTFMRFKKIFLNTLYTDSEQKIYINEDLTSTNAKALKTLANSELTSSVWSMKGRVMYTLKSDHKDRKTVYACKNPFSPLDSII